MSDRRATKRRKLAVDHEEVAGIALKSADQIYQWTKFEQSTDAETAQNLAAFENYLASIVKTHNAEIKIRQLEALKQYCEWQKAPNDDALNFSDLLSTWSLAVDNNAEDVITAVPSVLAQFLRTISGVLDLRHFGLALIDSLLRRDQAKLFDKCFINPKGKNRLASPGLQLLQELIDFDAGARSTQFWSRRGMVLPKLDALLEQRNTDNSVHERRQPSIRRDSQKLLITLLKYLSPSTKSDLLLQSRALHVCIYGLSLDADDIISDVLAAIHKFLIKDSLVSREALATFFTSARLELLLRLFTIDFGEGTEETKEIKDTIRNAAHQLLHEICSSEIGVLSHGGDWTIQDNDNSSLSALTQDTDFIDLGSDSTFLNTSSQVSQKFTNKEIANFVSRLRPLDDQLQRYLVLEILRAAPDLRPGFLSKQQRLPTPDVEDASWRTRFALLFSIVDLPPPDLSQCRTVPDVGMIIQSLTPEVLEGQYISNKLLSSTDSTLKVSGAKILTAMLKKLGQVMQMMTRCAGGSYKWQQAIEKVAYIAEERLPSARDVSLALQQSSPTDHVSRAALMECLCTYHQVLPGASSLSSFDIGPVMAKICSDIEDGSGDLDFLLEQLASCARIAELSPSTKWLHKGSPTSLSPLGRMLKVVMTTELRTETASVLEVLEKVLTGRGILNIATGVSTAFCNSLRAYKKFSPTSELFLFVDNCIARTNQRPVKYLDEIEEAAQLLSDKKPLSLVVAAISEQWELFLKNQESDKSTIKNIAMWVARLFGLLEVAGENYRVMTHFLEHMLQHSEHKPKKYLEDALEKLRKKPVPIEAVLEAKSAVEDDQLRETDQQPEEQLIPRDLQNLVNGIATIPESLEGLDRWSTMDIDVEYEMDTGRLEKLLRCLSSTDNEIRLQAFQLLQNVVHVVDTASTHPEKRQVWLALSETCETLRQLDLTQQVPSIISEFAIALMRIMLNPAHELYTKINKFVLQRPSWSSKRIIMQLSDRIIYKEPTGDEYDAWQKETSWLLDIFLISLRTTVDLDLYRRTSLWEKLLSLYSSPVVSAANKLTILAMIWRATDIDRGTEMLWTRFGVRSWLEMLVGTDKLNAVSLEALRRKMDATCDRELIDAWETACSLNKKDEKDA